jgi:diguanylate cyclase (GGDEF)-like protein
MGQMRVLNIGLFTKLKLEHDHFTLHRNAKGFEIDSNYEYIIPVDSSLVTLLTDEPKVYTLGELKEKVGGDPYTKILDKLLPTTIVPLLSKGYLNGILIMGERVNDEFLTDYEKEYLLNIARFAAIGIHNAILFEMATTDMMTKLKMRSYFLTVLMEEIDTAKKKRQPLSLIMLDIDHFKQFNDAYGHSCGDEVLKHVSRIIQHNTRSLDTAARFGGEEFILLLPNSKLETALHVGERIRKAIETSKIEYNEQSMNVTISGGIALYDPERDWSSNSFIDRADQALYLSKEQGRNRISVAE